MKIKKFENYSEVDNYMFFKNLDSICRMVTEMSQLDNDAVDELLSEHDWASDHISKSMESVSHVYNFLKNKIGGEKK